MIPRFADTDPRTETVLISRFRQSSIPAYGIARAAIDRRSSFDLIHLDTLLKIDAFIVKNTPCDRLGFCRKQADRLVEEVGGPVFNFTSKKDVVINQQQWFRLGQEVSDCQWFYVLGALKVQRPVIDREYQRRLARELDVSDHPEGAFTDAGFNETTG